VHCALEFTLKMTFVKVSIILCAFVYLTYEMPQGLEMNSNYKTYFGPKKKEVSPSEGMDDEPQSQSNGVSFPIPQPMQDMFRLPNASEIVQPMVKQFMESGGSEIMRDYVMSNMMTNG
jgi:hypothetical protein